MRKVILGGFVLAFLIGLAGCGGEGGGGTPVASAPPSAPPPPPSAAPPPPPATPAATETPVPPPAEQAPPPSEPAPTAPPAENPSPTPPPAETPPVTPAPAPEAAAPPAPKAPTLRERALVAFHAGKDDEAFQLLATHYLITLDATDDLLAKMQWVPGLRRPALATRFGLAVAYTAPAEFKDNPQPIGSKEAATAFAQNLRQPGSGDPNAAAAPAGEQGGTFPNRPTPP